MTPRSVVRPVVQSGGMKAPSLFPQAASLGCALLLSVIALPSHADILVRFIEGAPKDRFDITNQRACALEQTDVVIDLSGSAAGLLFDVTGQGAGVDVFQPFELVAGADAVASHTAVRDGDRQVTLKVSRLGPGASIAFTVDVDDTVDARGITIAGSEIQGAVVRVGRQGSYASGAFSREGTARVTMPACR